MAERTVELKFKISEEGTLRLESIKGGLQKITQEVSSMDKALRIIKWDAIINLGERAYQAAQRIYSFGKSIASATNDIGRNASVIGLSIAEYQRWTYAAKMADVSTESFVMGIKFLSRNIEDANRGIGDAKKYFDALGIKGKTTTEIMLELADKFKGAGDSGEQAARKIDYAMAVAGRGAMALVPLWNLGREGIKKFLDEAVKLGTVLGDVVVKKGSEAEDQFKKLEAQVNATKLSLAPAALAFANFFADIIKDAKGAIEAIWGIAEAISKKIDKAFEAQQEWKRKRGYPEIDLGLQLGLRTPSGIPTPGEEAERYRGRIPTIPEIPLPPIGLVEALRKLEIDFAKAVAAGVSAGWLDVLEDLPKGFVTITKQVEAAWEPILDIHGEIVGRQRDLNIVTEVWQGTIAEAVEWQKRREENEIKFNQLLIDAKNTTESWQPILEETFETIPKNALEIQIRLQENQLKFNMLLQEAKENTESWLDVLEELPKGVAIREWEKNAKLGETFARNMASAWNFNIKNIITESENMGDALRKVFLGMADAFTSAISKMISDWILFGSQYFQTGKYAKGAGLIGILGGLLPFAEGGIVQGWKSLAEIPRFQHGALIDRPTLGIVGEGGEREWIIPESKMKGGNTYYIDARGAQRGVSAEIMRAIRQSENRAVIRSVNTVAENKLRGGKFSRVFGS